jgi:hypothetical protein
MKYIYILSLITLFGISCILYYYLKKLIIHVIDVKQPISKKSDIYVTPDINVKHSDKLSCRGVFANKEYKIGDIIEICPTLLVPLKISITLQPYVFKYDDTHNVFPLGYCGMYNHSDTPNASWIITDNLSIKLEAIKDIKLNEEIYISYGDEYWKDIGIDKK